MPRQWIARFVPSPHALLARWPLRIFGERLADPKLWTFTRRGVCGGFGVGLSLCFVPLPVHTVLAVLIGVGWRINIPVIIGTTLIMNPLTMVPMFYAAYRVGTLLVGAPPGHFGFELSWDWLQHGLGPRWKPFLLGCLVCSAGSGLGGRWVAGYLWRRWIFRRRMRDHLVRCAERKSAANRTHSPPP